MLFLGVMACTATAGAATWVTDGGALNSEVFYDAANPTLAVTSTGTPYVTWFENNGLKQQVYVKHWNGAAWVQDGGSLNVNTSEHAYSAMIAVDSSGVPGVCWHEYRVATQLIYAKAWNGSSWVSLGTSLNVGSFDGAYPDLAINNSNVPYATWFENVGGHFQIFVKHWNGSSWVQDGTSLNVNSTHTAQNPTVAGSTLPYVAWSENNGTAFQVHAKHWNGSSWVQDGTTLNLNTTNDALLPVLAMDNTTPYIVFFQANGSPFYHVYVKHWNGSDWEQDGGMLNENANHTAGGWPTIAIRNHRPYVGWGEQNGVAYQAMVKHWNGSAWVQDGGVLNIDHTQSAQNVRLDFYGETLYAAWDEVALAPRNIHVKHMVMDSATPTPTVTPTSTATPSPTRTSTPTMTPTSIVGWYQLGGTLNVNASNSGFAPRVADVNGTPYIGWTEDNGSGVYQKYVKHWNGSAWVQDGTSLNLNQNISSSTGGIDASASEPYLLWSESSNIYMKRYSAGSWLNLGAPPIGINGSGYDQCLAMEGNLAYAAYTYSNGVASSLHALKWNGASWQDLGKPSSDNSWYGSIGVFNGTPYLAMSDQNLTLLVKHYNGASWVQDGVALNNNIAHAAVRPSLTMLGAMPYVAWEENNSALVAQTYVRRWNGGNWEQVGAGALNLNATSAAMNPRISANQYVPYVTWIESNGSLNQVVVKHWNGSNWTLDSGGLNVNPTLPGASPDIKTSYASVVVAWGEGFVTQQVMVKRLFIATQSITPTISATRTCSPTFTSTATPTPTVTSTPTPLPWKLLGGWLNSDPAQDATVPSLDVMANTVPYVAWGEIDSTFGSRQGRMKHWNGADWVADDTVFHEASADHMNYPSLAILGATPYVAWAELHLMSNRYNGVGWAPVGGYIEEYPMDNQHDLIMINGTPYLAYTQRDGSDQAYVQTKFWNGSDWEQVGTPFQSMASPNELGRPRIGRYLNQPIVAWEEWNYTTFQHQLRTKFYNGAAWEGLGALLNLSGYNATQPDLFVHDDQEVWLAWNEDLTGGTYWLVVSKYYGGSWTQVGNELNLSNNWSYQPSITVFNDVPYVAWMESNGVADQILVKHYNGADWELDGDMNIDPTQDASDPELVNSAQGMYLAWSEMSSVYGKKQVWVRQLSGLMYTPSATVSPTTSITSTRTPTSTPTGTPTPTRTASPTATPTFTTTPSVTSTPSRTNSPTETGTCTPTPSSTITPTASPSRTRTPTLTSTPWFSPTTTVTRTASPTRTVSATRTMSPTPAPPTPTPTFAIAPGQIFVVRPSVVRVSRGEQAQITLQLQAAGRVKLRVFNLQGKQVATLLDEDRSAGTYQLTWDAAGQGSGLYYLYLEAEGQRLRQKLVLVR